MADHSIKGESVFDVFDDKRLRVLHYKRDVRQGPQFLDLIDNVARFVSGEDELVSAICHMEKGTMYEVQFVFTTLNNKSMPSGLSGVSFDDILLTSEYQ